MERKPTIYVAGPMRGHHDYNYPAFDRQTRILKAQGWHVVNPADMDRKQFQPSNDPYEFDPDINYEDQEFMRDALKRDMVAICDNCTAVYMMAGWESSSGARAEHALAKALGLSIFYEAPLPE